MDSSGPGQLEERCRVTRGRLPGRHLHRVHGDSRVPRLDRDRERASASHRLRNITLVDNLYFNKGINTSLNLKSI